MGIGLSLIWLISVATRPPMPLLGRDPATQYFRELSENPGDEQFPGLVVLRLDGGLFFATADALEDRIREVALSSPGVREPAGRARTYCPVQRRSASGDDHVPSPSSDALMWASTAWATLR